jgi:hypothetical protein
MERLLITVDQFRDGQVKHVNQTNGASIALARQLLPEFMGLINDDLVSQSGGGIMFRLYTVVDRVNHAWDSISNYDAFSDEIIRLLEEQFELVDDFTCTISGDMIVIKVDEDYLNRTFYKLNYAGSPILNEPNMVLVRYHDGSFARYDTDGNADRRDLDHFLYPCGDRVAEAFQRNIDNGTLEEADDEWINTYAHPSIRVD